MKVYKAINEVLKELSTNGIAKGRKTQFGSKYDFRGIDDIYNNLSSLLGKHGLCILPRVINRSCVERVSQTGGAVFYVVVETEFDFISSEDGSKHTIKTFGEAMDSSDKATNKAMSAAYKYAAIQAFCIPTEGDNDTENSSHELKPTSAQESKHSINNPNRPDLSGTLFTIQKATTEDQLRDIYNNFKSKFASDNESLNSISAACRKKLDEFRNSQIIQDS